MRTDHEPPALIPSKGIEECGAMSEIAFSVPDMSCDHCRRAVTSELLEVDGVESVLVDLETKVVTVRGPALDDSVLRAVISEAGYDVA
jgi:copper chaperone CopZ